MSMNKYVLWSYKYVLGLYLYIPVSVTKGMRARMDPFSTKYVLVCTCAYRVCTCMYMVYICPWLYAQGQYVSSTYKYVPACNESVLVCTSFVSVHTWLYCTEPCFTGFCGAWRDANTRVPDVQVQQEQEFMFHSRLCRRCCRGWSVSVNCMSMYNVLVHHLYILVFTGMYWVLLRSGEKPETLWWLWPALACGKWSWVCWMSLWWYPSILILAHYLELYMSFNWYIPVCTMYVWVHTSMYFLHTVVFILTKKSAPNVFAAPSAPCWGQFFCSQCHLIPCAPAHPGS
jgi:hypothetical protein